MKLSIIIPAYNEQQRLPACLASIDRAVADVARSRGGAPIDFEVIVTDNNSTDGTAAVARNAGARVVFEPVNQISRARNAGAAVAAGDWLLFIDADSQLDAATLADLLATIARGNVAGGGCLIGLDFVPWWGRSTVAVWNCLSRLMHWAAGSFVFCRADAFRELGGFSLALYAAEEIDLSMRLKRWARSRGLSMKILTAAPHVSSGRKFQLYSAREVAAHALRCLIAMRRTLGDRSRLDFFYDGRR